MPPIATAETASSASEMPGQTRLRITALENTRIAMATTIEMYARISLAGSNALTSV
jgi:hypothetical protein